MATAPHFTFNADILERVSYHPYGEPHREPSGQRILYSGKERQDFIANGTSDFGPRRYFSALSLWGAGDIKAADYADISPYVFCGANPIRNIDPSRNNVVVLHKREHLAMLIQNESGKYQYYSVNGDNIYPVVNRFSIIIMRLFSAKHLQK